jgi:hypothetical protein
MMLYGSIALQAAVGGDLPQLGTDTHEFASDRRQGTG